MTSYGQSFVSFLTCSTIDLAVRSGPESNWRLMRLALVIIFTRDPPTSIDRMMRRRPLFFMLYRPCWVTCNFRVARFPQVSANAISGSTHAFVLDNAEHSGAPDSQLARYRN